MGKPVVETPSLERHDAEPKWWAVGFRDSEMVDPELGWCWW